MIQKTYLTNRSTSIKIINSTILLKQTTIYFCLDGRFVESPAKVILKFSPIARCVIEFELTSDQYEVTKEIGSKEFSFIRLKEGPTIKVYFANDYKLGDGKISGTLIPIEQPVTIRNSTTKINECKFCLVNFPSLWGAQDLRYKKRVKGKVHEYITQHLEFRVPPWTIEIRAVDSLISLDYKLKQEGGSAITHVVHITQDYRKDFHLNELQCLLNALHLFFSFARGSYCGLTLLTGQDLNRKSVWEQWGTYEMEPWRRDLSTWVCESQSEMLSTVFCGFWNRFKDQKWKGTIQQAIHWYLRSNGSSEPSVSIILTQVALERLSFHILGKRENYAAQTIRSALEQTGIKAVLPKDCPELKKLYQGNDWDGPRTFVEIRNVLVHPKTKHEPVARNAYLEAHNLGQWYIELMLLNLFGYTGQYRNRLKRGHGYQSEIESVPWS